MPTIGSPSGSVVCLDNSLPARRLFPLQEKSEGTKQHLKVVRMLSSEGGVPSQQPLTAASFPPGVDTRGSKLLCRPARTHTSTHFSKCLISNPANSGAYCRENNKSLNRNSACARSRVMKIIREHYCLLLIFFLCVCVRGYSYAQASLRTPVQNKSQNVTQVRASVTFKKVVGV